MDTNLSIVFLEGAYGAGGDGGYFCSVWLRKKVNYVFKALQWALTTF